MLPDMSTIFICAVHRLERFSRSAVQYSSRRGINFCVDHPLDLLRFTTFILDLLKPSELDAFDRVRDTVARPDGDGAGQISRQSVEQDHRFIKRRVITLLRIKSFQSAASTIARIKLVTVIRKGPVPCLAPSFPEVLSYCCLGAEAVVAPSVTPYALRQIRVGGILLADPTLAGLWRMETSRLKAAASVGLEGDRISMQEMVLCLTRGTAVEEDARAVRMALKGLTIIQQVNFTVIRSMNLDNQVSKRFLMKSILVVQFYQRTSRWPPEQ